MRCSIFTEGMQFRSLSSRLPPTGCHLYFARRVSLLSCADTFVQSKRGYFVLNAPRPKSFTSWFIARMKSDCAALSRLDLYVSAIFAVCLSEIRSCSVAALSACPEMYSQNSLGIVYSRGPILPPCVFTLVPTHCFGRGMAMKPSIRNGPGLAQVKASRSLLATDISGVRKRYLLIFVGISEWV